MGKYKKLLSNTLILSIGTFASKLLVYFLVPFYTFILTQEDYGTADLITNAANLLIPIFCFGITHAVFRFAADGEEDKARVFSSGVFVLFAASILFLALSPLLSFIPLLRDYIRLLVVYVLCANIHAVCAEYVRAVGKTVLYAAQGILGTVLTIGFNLLFLLPLHMGLVGYVLSVAAADAVTSVVLIFAAKLYRVFSVRHIRFPKVGEMLKYSIPMIPTGIIWWITNVSDRFMVTYMRSEAENGLYAAAYKIPTLLTLVATVFIEAWQISAIADTKGEEDCRYFFGQVFSRYQAIIFLGSSALVALSHIAADLLFDDKFMDAWQYIPVLLLATAFSALSSFMATVYAVKKRSQMAFLTALVGAVVNIGLNILLIPPYGAQGAGIATLVSYVVLFFVRVIHCKTYFPFRMSIPKVLINAAIVTAQAVWFLMDMPYNILIQIACVGAMTIVNARSILTAVVGILKDFSKKSEKM